MLEQLTTPLDLEGQQLGPVSVGVTADRVAFFVDATGDDPGRWSDQAPPGFGSVLLFAVADIFLYHPKVIPFTATLLHLDQTFEYLTPMPIGTTLTVAGTVTRVRERAGSFFVTFEAIASEGDRDVVRSVSTFVLSDQPAPAPDLVRAEPPARSRADTGERDRSASRHDLVRYAAATRDFNPLHWDHDVAVAAGLPGTVVHGLLMYAWLSQAVLRDAGGSLLSMKVRFRSALHPGELASISTSVDGESVKFELSRGDTQLVTGAASVSHE